MARGKTFPLTIELRTLDRATAGLRKIGVGLGKIGKRLEGIGKRATRVGKKLTTSLTLPIVGIGAAAVSTFAGFEKGMASVSTLVDTATVDMAKMGKEVLAIGKNTPVALGDLTDGLFDLISAGIPAGDAIRVLGQSAKLGVAGLGTTKQAVDLVTSAINAFQLEGAEADKVYDQIFKTTKNGKTTIAELSQGFGAVAGTVNAAGIKLDDYLSAVSALTTTGLKAAGAHTQLKAIISGLTRDTKDSRKVFRALGAKDFPDLIKKSGTFGKAIQRVSKHLGGNKARILKLVGSTEALNAVIGVAGAQNKAYTGTLADMRTGAEAMTGAFDKQSKTTSARLQKMKNRFAAVGVTVGRIMIPALEKLGKFLERTMDWFENLDEGTRRWIVKIAGIVAVVGPAIFILGKLAAGLGIVASAFKVITFVLLGNPIGLAVTAIGIAALVIIKHWAPIKQFFVDLWDGITNVFNAALANITRVVGKIVTAAKRVKSLAFGSASGLAQQALQAKIAAGSAGAPGAGGQASVKVEFVNAPRGTRVTKDAGSTVPVETNTGYQMGD